MAIQTVNTYAFAVRRVGAQVSGPLVPGGSSPSVLYPGSGASMYEPEQVTVVATSLANAIATLTANYGSDLASYTGGAQLVPGSITQLA